MARVTTPMTEPGPSTVSTSTTVTDPTDIDPCPYCGTASGVQRITGTSLRVQAWSCTACQTKWAITTVNPQLYLDRLAATVEQLFACGSVPQSRPKTTPPPPTNG
jgi:ribosomal protein L37AE/L43A